MFYSCLFRCFLSFSFLPSRFSSFHLCSDFHYNYFCSPQAVIFFLILFLPRFAFPQYSLHSLSRYWRICDALFMIYSCFLCPTAVFYYFLYFSFCYFSPLLRIPHSLFQTSFLFLPEHISIYFRRTFVVFTFFFFSY